MKHMCCNTAGTAPASRSAGYDVDPYGRVVCPRCYAFRSVRVGMRFVASGYFVCLACGLKVPAADEGSELDAALDGLAKRGVITPEQAEQAKRRIAAGGAA